MSEFYFHSISWEQIYWIWPNFAYALILTTSRLGLLHISFHEFIRELWPLIDVGILFPLNILRPNWWNLTKFFHICIYIGKIQDGIITHLFLQWPLIDVRISFRLNILRTPRWIWPNFAYALILTTSRLGLINIFYTQYLDKYEFGILLSVYFGDLLYSAGYK